MTRIRSHGVTTKPHIVAPPPPPSLPLPLRAAFYYPWFGAGGASGPGWTQQGFTPFTYYTPSLGFYDSSNATIISDHIAAMQYGKMNAGIASWWGPDPQQSWNPNPPANFTDLNFPLLLAGAVGTQFRWAPYYEKEGNATPPAIPELEGDLNYLLTNYSQHPNFLWIAGKPVIFVYGNGTDGVTYYNNWVTAAAGQWYVVLKVYPGYQTQAALNGVQGWHQYGPAVAEDHQPNYSFTISPGWWEKAGGSPPPMLVRDPVRWVTNVQDMIASNEPLQLVTTFNEYGEGTAVESTTTWPSASGQGTYLDTLHNIIGGGATAPGVPTGVTATAGNAQATVTWTAPPNGGSGITQYTITPTGSGSPQVVNGTPPVTNVTMTGLTNGTPVFFTVHATNAIGSSGESAASNTVTPTGVVTPVVPNAPTNFVATPSRTTTALTWTAATVPAGSPAVTSYTLTVTPSVTGSPFTLGVVTSDTVSNMTPSTFYSFSLTAHNSVGNSSPATVTTTTLAPVPPPANPGIMLILMENNSYDNIFTSGDCPYQTNTLKANYAYASTSWGASHPSAPNYTTISGGDSYGATDGSPVVGNHPWLATQLQTAGVLQSWYLETGGAPKHNPPQMFTGWSNSGLPPGESTINVNTSIANLSTTSGTPSTNALITELNTSNNQFYWITPSLVHDTHDIPSGQTAAQACKNGDNYLAALIPKIQATKWYTNGGIIIVTYDEAYNSPGGTAGGSSGNATGPTAGEPAPAPTAATYFAQNTAGKTPVTVTGGHIPTMFVSQNLSNQSLSFNTPLTHIGVLQAIQGWYGLSTFTVNQASSTQAGGPELLAFLKANA